MRGRRPTEGELYLLRHLEEQFDPDAEACFQPCFNGDWPDVVIMKKDVGVIIIEVKDRESLTTALTPRSGPSGW